MSSPHAERRKWPRIPAEALSHIAASVVAGPPVKLVNLSRGGALMEVASRFPMRSRVRLKLTVATGEVTVAEGLVAWARVAAIVDKQVNYFVAVVFDKPIPDLGGLDPQPVPESAPTAEIVEAPGATEAIPSRGNVSQFPIPVPRAPEPAPVADPWSDDEEVISLDAAVSNAGEAVGEAAERVAALSAANETLVAQLAAAEAVSNELREEVDADRRARDEERARLLQELAAAAASTETVQSALAAMEQQHARALEEQRAMQAALASREQEHVRAAAQLDELQARCEALHSTLATREQELLSSLAEQKASYEALTAELLQAAQDQQAEMQLLLSEQAATRDEERRRSDAHALELARVQEEATQAREQLELKYHDVQARLDAALTRCADQDIRDRNLRSELEKLATMITALASNTTLEEESKAVA